jgi:hypothetical protein
MTRTIQLHPLSLLVGVGFALLGVVAMGQMPAAKRPAAAHDSGLLQVAHPRDWVVVEEGVPYTVPQGKILVVTAIGAAHNSGGIGRVLVNGTIQCETANDVQFGNGASVKQLPLGFSVTSGSTVDTMCTTGLGRAWGYLVDA